MNKSFFIITVSIVLLLSASIFWAITRTNSKQPASSKEPANQPSPVAELTAESATQVLTNTPGILIVDFYAEWCGPCKTLKPVFDQVAEELKNTHSFARANVDHCANFAKEFQIMSIPTIVIFSNGKVVDKIVGMIAKDALIERIEQALKGPQDLSTLSQETLNEKLIQAIQGTAAIDDIKKIIDAGADVNHVTSGGMMPGITPLLMAILINGSRGIDATDLVSVLLKNGASTEFVDTQNGTKTQAFDFVQMMSQNAKRIAENYDKMAQVLKENQPKTKEDRLQSSN